MSNLNNLSLKEICLYLMICSFVFGDDYNFIFTLIPVRGKHNKLERVFLITMSTEVS